MRLFSRSAYAAYIAGILINVVGFAGASAFLSLLPFSITHISLSLPAAGRTVPVAATHIYQMSFFTGFGVSAVIYCALNYVFPPAGMHQSFAEVDVSDYEEEEKERDSETSSLEKDVTPSSHDMVRDDTV